MSSTYFSPPTFGDYTSLLAALGVHPDQFNLEVIDVDAAPVHVLQSTRHETSVSVGRLVGVTAGRVRQGASAVSGFFRRAETKSAVMIAHWATWSIFMIALMSLATTSLVTFLLFAVYVYVSHLLFQSIDNFS